VRCSDVLWKSDNAAERTTDTDHIG